MIKLRAHHLLCLVRNDSVKGWYNHELLHHVKEIRRKIIKQPNQKIKILRACDDICKKCPYIKNKICNKPSKYKISHWVKVMDNKAMRLIKIKPNSIQDISKALMKATKIDDEKLKNICKGCESLYIQCLKFGLNKPFLEKIK